MRRALFVGLVSLCAGLAHAQSTTSTILGQVRAETGAALPGAEVTARHLESGLARTAVSDAQGRFVLPALPLGGYEVRATLDRFRPLRPARDHARAWASRWCSPSPSSWAGPRTRSRSPRRPRA